MQGAKKMHLKYRFIGRLIAYWAVFLLLILLFIGGSWYYLQSFSPVYRAAVKISANNQETTDTIINTFRSEELSTKVVYDLQLYTEIFKKRTLKYIPVYANPPLFIQADKGVLIEPKDKINMIVSGSTVTVDHNIHLLNKWGYTAFGKFKFVKNPNFNSVGDDDFYISFIPVKYAAKNLLSRLHVSASGDPAGMVSLSIEDEVPQKARDILNSFVKFYNASYAGIQDANPRHELKLINLRIAKVEGELLAIEKQLHEQRNMNHTNRATITERQKTETTLYTNLLQKKEAASLALTLPASRPAVNIVNTSVLPVTTVPNTRLIYLLGILIAVVIALAIIAVREIMNRKTPIALASETNDLIAASDSESERVNIVEQLKKLKQSIKKSISWDRLIHEDVEQLAIATNGDMAPNKLKKQAFIDRLRGVFLEWLAKLNRTIVVLGNFKFFTKNIETDPKIPVEVIPHKSIYKPVVKFQQLDNINPIDEYQPLLPVQEEATIDISPSLAEYDISADGQQQISIADQFTRLRRTLSELGINGDRKKVMITSATPGEEKDFIATNLALSLALSGKRVVLIDFDVHQSSLGNKLGVKQRTGISDYLKGKARFDDIILSTEIDKNLFFIPAGQVANEGGHELKMNDLVPNMLNQLSNSFDHIIVSAAPVRPFADAYALSALCDATLYIVRHAFSPKTFIAQFNKFNVLNRLKNAAVIFNEA